MGIFDGLLDPSAVGGAFQQGLQHGTQQREEREVKGALSAYAVNPDDEGAFQTLARYKPEMAISIGQDRAKRAEQARLADLQRRAASGDQSALAEMAGVDLDAWSKLDTATRARVKGQSEYVGQAAMAIRQLPEAERPAAWDRYAQQGAAQYPELGQLVGRYDPAKLDAAIAQAGLVKQFIDLQMPDYRVVPKDADLVNTRDPAAVREFTGGRAASDAPITREYGGVTYYQSPDGKWHDAPIGGQGAPDAPFSGPISFQQFKRGIIRQESGGRYGVPNAEGSGAMGIGQIMPATAQSLSRRLGLQYRPDLLAGTTPEAQQYQDALTDEALREAWQAGGNGADPATAAMYYHGGSNRKIWGPKTRQYGQQVLRRMRGS